MDIDGYGEFDVNVTANKPINDKEGNRIYTLELTIENPSVQGQDSLSQRGISLNTDGSPKRILSAYQSFVEKEMLAIKINAEAKGSFMKAPNGKPSNLTERQWLTVCTKAFKNWFGDWENAPEKASKVVAENGEPLVVYHGTTHGGFTIFDDYAKDGLKNSYTPDGAFYFISDMDSAHDYSKGAEGYARSGTMVYSVFLNIKNPKTVDFNSSRWNWNESKAFLMQKGKRI